MLHITIDNGRLAAAGNPQIRLYEVTSNNNQPVLTYDGHTANVTAVRLVCCDCTAREACTRPFACMST